MANLVVVVRYTGSGSGSLWKVVAHVGLTVL